MALFLFGKLELQPAVFGLIANLTSLLFSGRLQLEPSNTKPTLPSYSGHPHTVQVAAATILLMKAWKLRKLWHRNTARTFKPLYLQRFQISQNILTFTHP
jgi:hypothetical protein